MRIKTVIHRNPDAVIATFECPYCGCTADRWSDNSKDFQDNIKCPNCGKTEKDIKK